MRRTTLAAVALAIFALDRGTKLVIEGLDLRAPIQLVGSLLQIVRGENRGGLFGIVQGSAPLLAVLSVGVVVALVMYHDRERTTKVTLLTIGVGLLVGGAAGNFVDRIAFGYVLDFIDFGVGTLRFWTFNIADAGISIGILTLLADTLLRSRGVARV